MKDNVSVVQRYVKKKRAHQGLMMYYGTVQLYKHNSQSKRRIQEEKAQTYTTVARKETIGYAAKKRDRARRPQHAEKGAAVMKKQA